MKKNATVFALGLSIIVALNAAAWGAVTYYSQANGAPTTLTNWNTVRAGGE